MRHDALLSNRHFCKKFLLLIVFLAFALAAYGALSWFHFAIRRHALPTASQRNAETGADASGAGQWTPVPLAISSPYTLVHAVVEYRMPGSATEIAVAKAAPNSFEVSTIDPEYAKDASHVYHSGHLFSYYPTAAAYESAAGHLSLAVNAPTFKVIPGESASGKKFAAYVEDARDVFYPEPSGIFLRISTSSATFQSIPNGSNGLLAKDAYHVYADGSIIPHADPNTYQVLMTPNGNFTNIEKDKNNVYCDGGNSLSLGGALRNATTVPIAQFDPSTFTLFFDRFGAMTYFAKDRYHIYSIIQTDDGGCSFSVVQGANQATFRPVLSESGHTSAEAAYGSYGEDGLHVFYANHIIPEADPTTFTLDILTNQFGQKVTQAEDKNHTYLNGKVVQ